jgi:hypothetical protein
LHEITDFVECLAKYTLFFCYMSAGTGNCRADGASRAHDFLT